MFNPNVYQNSRPDGIAVLEILPEEGDGEPPRRFVPLKRTELTGEVAGPLASLRLVQTYGYSREQCDRTLEALYRFPLPGDAAVTGVVARFGEVTIRAELKAREQAEADYEAAKKQGRQAALATRETPDVFTLAVAGLQPDQDVVVETEYTQLARAEGLEWTLRIPLTTAPRYTREDESGSRYSAGQLLALRRDPGYRFAMDILVQNAAGVSSATHALETAPEAGGSLRVRLREGEVVPDRDCVLAWQPLQETQHPALHALLHEDRAAGKLYFLAQIAPPSARTVGGGVAREVVILVDHSGSMNGAKWEAADWAVKKFLSGLTARDLLALGVFHNDTKWLAPKLLEAEPDTLAEAARFLEANKDSGGTNLGVALEQALHLPRGKGERARHVLIVTDAQVTDAGRLLRLAEAESARQDRRRISLLCIDAAPNDFLARALAERGGGIARFLTSAPEEEDITTALDAVLEDWAAPVLTDLRLEVSRPGMEAAEGETVAASRSGGSAMDLGDLPAGRAIWVAGRVPRGETADLAFRVRTEDGQEIAACRRDLAGEDLQHPALKALFGARRVLGLEFLMHSGYEDKDLRAELKRLGYDPATALAADTGKKVYAENTRRDAEAALRGLLAKEALDYGLASAETAFVAVREEAGKPVEGTVFVANALPSGWSPTFHTGGGVAYMAAAVPQPVAYRMASPDISSDLYDIAPDGSSQGNPSGLAKRAETRRLETLATRRRWVKPETPLFSGVPVFIGGEAVLFDSARDSGRRPDGGLLSRLEIRFPNGAPDATALDAGLALLLFVDDMAAPRAKVGLADLLRQGGMRPLNIRYAAGQAVRLVLTDPNGAWAKSAPPMLVFLA